MGSDPENPDPNSNSEQDAHKNSAPPDPPPIFASWGRAYAFVIGFLLLQILLYYLFTIAYS